MRKHCAPSYRYLQSSGFALLEILISILVIGFGLLGLAGLQGSSLRNNHSALLRSEATLYALDIADRIRANRNAYFSIDYNIVTATDIAACHPSSSPVGCTYTDMAKYDKWVWGQMVSQLPGGSAVVCVDSTPTTAACDNLGYTYAIKISWNDGLNSDGTNKVTTFITQVQP